MAIVMIASIAISRFGIGEKGIRRLALLKRFPQSHDVESELLCDRLFVPANFLNDRVCHREGCIILLQLPLVSLRP